MSVYALLQAIEQAQSAAVIQAVTTKRQPLSHEAWQQPVGVTGLRTCIPCDEWAQVVLAAQAVALAEGDKD